RSGEDRWLEMDVQRDDSQGGGARDRDVYPSSAFTPDSSALITSYDGRIWRIAIPSGTATEIPFTARVEQDLGPLVKFEYRIHVARLPAPPTRGPRRPPGGSRIVFAALDRLCVANLPSGRGTKKDVPAKPDPSAAPKEAQPVPPPPDPPRYP